MVHSFAEKLRKLCADRQVTIPQLCAMAGINYKTLNSQLKRGSKISIETVDEISKALDVPIAYFSKYSPNLSVSHQGSGGQLPQLAGRIMDAAMNEAHLELMRQQSKISTMDVVNWLRRTNYRLEDYDALKESADLFHVMKSEDRVPQPYRLGRLSLATEIFDIENESHYVQKLGQFDDALLENIKSARIEASYHPYMLSDVNMRVEVGGRVIQVMYCRLIASVFLPNNQELTLVHSEMIPKSHWSGHAQSDHDLIQQPRNPASGHQG